MQGIEQTQVLVQNVAAQEHCPIDHHYYPFPELYASCMRLVCASPNYTAEKKPLKETGPGLLKELLACIFQRQINPY